ncbi:MAG: tRNA (adenosine(37)-N6)-threonylcarbamoyltransferase complex dimerization subunit type 1 TsaB [Aerococcus sp.]|nr:tRNA (adenosine(37)-N6)-threonylcarbamoyltransferase complex dimerization subunit type 1 TsaB [Aerococcus sp.]
MKILALDTSTKAMSIALMEAVEDLNHARMQAETTTNTKIKHSTQLLPLVESLLRAIHWAPTDIEAVIVTRGPGSYTGLRIGVTFAKTMAWTLNIPLYSITSLEALSANHPVDDGLIFTFINARRQTLFGAGYQFKQGTIAEEVVTSDYYTLAEFLAQVEQVLKETTNPNQSLYFVSPDYQEFHDAIVARFGEQAVILTGEEVVMRASQWMHLPLRREDVATFIPEYLKRAEAEEHWREAHQEEALNDGGHYVERAD